MDSYPQYFESANLVLDVQRFDVDDVRSDAHVRLVGWLNGQEFIETVSVWFSARGRRSLLYVLLMLIFPGLRYRGLQQQISVRLKDALDEAAGYPMGVWRRFARTVRTAFHG
jgi:hypothetical protein